MKRKLRSGRLAAIWSLQRAVWAMRRVSVADIAGGFLLWELVGVEEDRERVSDSARGSGRYDKGNAQVLGCGVNDLTHRDVTNVIARL